MTLVDLSRCTDTGLVYACHYCSKPTRQAPVLSIRLYSGKTLLYPSCCPTCMSDLLWKPLDLSKADPEALRQARALPDCPLDVDHPCSARMAKVQAAYDRILDRMRRRSS